MDFENEKNYEEKPAAENQSTGSREGHQETGSGFQREYRGRSPRPRIHTGQRPAFNSERPAYNRRDNDEAGFRPEGFGAGLQSSQPRQSQTEYGQQSRGEFGQSRQQGYRPRTNYNGGGYQSRQQGGRPGNRPYGKGGYGNAPYGSKKSYGKRPRTADYDPNAKYSLKKRIEYKEVNYDPNEPVTLEKKVYVLLNKPKDYVTTSDDPQQRKTVMDLVKNACPERIYPVGRLDRNTTGVLLLTNDGDLASKLTHPKYLKKKIYHVYLDKNVTAHDLQAIAEGIQLEDGEIKADDVQYADAVDKKQVGIEIHSGKNRIVRRIFESLGYKVLKLDRVQFAGLTKKNLRRGDWRYLTEEEVDRLRMGAYE